MLFATVSMAIIILVFAGVSMPEKDLCLYQKWTSSVILFKIWPI